VDLRHLSIDMARDVLEEWLRLNRLSGDVYEALPEPVKEWARDNGGGFGTLLPTLALMDPVRRETAGAVVEGLLRTIDDISASLSYPRANLDDVEEDRAIIERITDERALAALAGLMLSTSHAHRAADQRLRASPRGLEESTPVTGTCSPPEPGTH
jgi:hypothetical protein